MRMIVRRGERVVSKDGTVFTFLRKTDTDKNFCHVLNADGKVQVVSMDSLVIHEIDTKDYEKI